MFSFKGTPAAIGRAYGAQCRDSILANLKILVYRVGHPALPRQDKAFLAWMRHQESLLGKHWPWLLEEMQGVAQGAGFQYEDILLLNLRAWQFEYYGATPQIGGCSSLAITLADGTVACAGALDDPPDYYCGPVHFQPTSGHALITFPITGTSWGNRGMNRQGLTTGISSQLLPGLRNLPQAINQDLALRVILQTCRTVDEVREFCRAFPFTMNLVAVDAGGRIFCAQNTAAGLFELPADGYCALTNHVADERLRQWLKQQGVTEIPESPTTVPRQECLRQFAKARNGKCTLTEVMDFIGHRDDQNPGTIHNSGSICLTVANPQVAAQTLWIRQPRASDQNTEFIPQTIGA
jgi:hypothetical protein